MTHFVQFITVPTADTPGSLLVLHFEDARYLFGTVAEGSQRAFIENGIRVTRTKEVFLTGKTEWRNTGGLFGLALTLAEVYSRQRLDEKQKAGARKKQSNEAPARLGVHGGENLLHTLACGRRFIFRRNLPIDAEEFTELNPRPGLSHTWEDHNLKVWQMKIVPSSKSTSTAVDEQQRKHDTDERRGIVSLMFNSDWQEDALVEQRLGDCDATSKMFVRNPATKTLEPYKGPPVGHPDADPGLQVLTRKPWPASVVPEIPPANPADSCMCYIAKSHPQRGRFDSQKARELGLKPGPLFGQLTKGISVQTESGVLVSPEMVMSPDRLGLGIAVINIPHKDYIDSLINRPEWRDETVMQGVEAFCWQLAEGIWTDRRLQQFRNRFPKAKHFVSSPEHCPNSLTFKGAAANAIRLSTIAPEQFKVPIHDNLPLVERRDPYQSERIDDNVVVAIPGMKVQIAPTYKLYKSPVEILNTRQIVTEMPYRALGLAKKAQRRISEKSGEGQPHSHLPGQDAQIITLGTGSSQPSKYRNVSATLLRVPGYGSYLFDCGENTLGQLRRTFEPDELDEIFRDLKMVWISHLHADHHLGLISVIKAWHESVHGPLRGRQSVTAGASPTPRQPKQQMNGEPSSRQLAIVSDFDLLTMLTEYSSAEHFGLEKCLLLGALWRQPGEQRNSFQVMTVEDGKVIRGNLPPGLPNYVKKATGLQNILYCTVSHCRGALGVSIEFDNGFKVSYSGDCRPSKRFAEIGAGSTVLIHEATFDDTLHGDAVAKKHSTTSEAIAVGAAMGAHRVVLTHFSQRYPKIPVMSTLGPLRVDFEDDIRDSSIESSITTAVPPNDMKVCVAFDYLRVRVGDIADMEHYSPAFVELFPDTQDDDDDMPQPEMGTGRESTSKDGSSLPPKDPPPSSSHADNNGEGRPQSPQSNGHKAVIEASGPLAGRRQPKQGQKREASSPAPSPDGKKRTSSTSEVPATAQDSASPDSWTPRDTHSSQVAEGAMPGRHEVSV